MSGKLPGLQRRLGRVERTFGRIAKKAALANCICVESIFPYNAQEFELEMNRPCPVHGFRSLRKIQMLYISPTGAVLRGKGG